MTDFTIPSLEPFLDGTGFEPKNSFWKDFSIADWFGEDAIKDTYEKLFNDYKDDYKDLTELVMMLNFKIWQHNGINGKYAELYNELWGKTDLYAMDNLKGEELQYFIRTLD